MEMGGGMTLWWPPGTYMGSMESLIFGVVRFLLAFR